ncbi:MAG: cupin domain-containing protein, partial [Candidatus Aminicenantales bacterium]
ERAAGHRLQPGPRRGRTRRKDPAPSSESSEVYYLLEGRGLMHVGNEQAEVAAGQAVYIPPDTIQFIENPGPGRLVFLCIVDPAWTTGDEEVLS